MWLRVGGRISADHALRASVDTERPNQGIGEGRQLVGDDAPGHAALIQSLEHRFHLRKQACLVGEIFSVGVEKRVPHPILGFLVAALAHGHVHHDPTPFRDQGANGVF
jgi:hypothetical protein